MEDQDQSTQQQPCLCLSASHPKHLYLALDELANGGPERQQRHAQEHAQGTIHEPSSDQQWMDYHDAWKENFCA
jgi:hypothetical protein